MTTYQKLFVQQCAEGDGSGEEQKTDELGHGNHRDREKVRAWE